ncbi:MAG TPA: cyclic nucleotide-binding domain-containing protein [Nitrospirales bacterium]|jgi:CRP-like cAMP-binding protein
MHKLFSPDGINGSVAASKKRKALVLSPNRVRPLAMQLSPIDRALSDILKGLTGEETALLVLLSRVIICQSGEFVARVGEPGGELFLVLAGGLVEISEQMPKQSLPAAIFLRGDICAETPFYTRGLRKTSIVALGACQLLAITSKTLDGLIGTQPRMAAKIFGNLAGIVAARFQQEVGSDVPQAMTSLPTIAIPTSAFPA